MPTVRYMIDEALKGLVREQIAEKKGVAPSAIKFSMVWRDEDFCGFKVGSETWVLRDSSDTVELQPKSQPKKKKK